VAAAHAGTGALWWLYFGEVAENSRRHLAESEDPGRLARDAYTYLTFQSSPESSWSRSPTIS
jgi:low temperature requirement protein LtrA